MSDPVRDIAEAVLYEGYLLWPYRRSALKNRQRWTLGGVYPERWSAHGGQSDAWQMQCEVLIEAESDATIGVELRFLHVVDRQVARMGADGPAWVDAIEIDGRRHVSWEEALEREVVVPGRQLGELHRAPARVPIDIRSGGQREALESADGAERAAIVREWRSLRGSIEIAAASAADGLWRIRALVCNSTPFEGQTRRDALRHTLVAGHLVLRTEGGAFVSAIDPPPRFSGAAAECRNVGMWPVLAGEEGDRRAMLCAPIILYDYPRIAPESPQNLFDATEIDQLLVLNVLSLTEDEQREIRESDPRGRALLDRCASLTPQELGRLHGAIRDVRARPGETAWP